jgi:hypothetical protein
MKKLLLAGVAALLMVTSAVAADEPPEDAPPVKEALPPRAPPGPPPLGTVYTQYTVCMEPRTCPIVYVSVDAPALNVRGPNGEITMALVNGTPLRVLGRNGQWTLVAPACDLTQTWVWTWTGAPLMRCWVYW